MSSDDGDAKLAEATPETPATPETRTPSAADVAESDRLKALGNSAFQAHKYIDAIAEYTSAIDKHPTNHVLFANRAFCHIRIENFGYAKADAERSIELAPSYAKGYYRRGSAAFAQGHYKDALRDFRRVKQLCPTDRSVAERCADCEKIVKRQAFEDAITCDYGQSKAFEELDVDAMEVEASYTGVRLPDDGEVTREFVLRLLDELKSQKVLHRRYMFALMKRCKELFEKQASLVDVTIPVGARMTVCGDVHGQFYDLCNIWETNGYPSDEHLYLFNGDFVDRGSFSVEVIVALMAWKACYPSTFFMARGNHEAKSMNRIYGFEGEVRKKYNESAYDLFCELFCCLPLAHCIQQRVLVVHGGLFSKDGVKLDDLRKIDRRREPGDAGLMCEMMWSDPSPVPGRSPSKRGVGVAFGPDVTERFLADNRLELLVRSHEVKDAGYEVECGGKLITVFSAPNYCDQVGNKGAWIDFTADDMTPRMTSFAQVPHPKLPPMAYASGLGMNLFGY